MNLKVLFWLLITVIFNSKVECDVRIKRRSSFSSRDENSSMLGSPQQKCFCDFQSVIRRLTCSNRSRPLLDINSILNEPIHWCVQHLKAEKRRPTFGDIHELVILNIHLNHSFSLNSLEKFTKLRRLTFNHNNFSGGKLKLYKPYPSFLASLEELDLSSNDLNSIQPELMYSMPLLKILNINNNNLTTLLLNLFNNNSHLSQVHMRDNPWGCTDLEWFLDWLDNNSRVVVEERQLVNCSYHERNSIFGSTTFANLLDECPKSCVCRMVRSMIKVDCRNRGLTSFPPLVPAYTGILHVENNRIDNLASLINGTNYLNLRFLYLDNNSIDSISILESTDIFDNLFALHLSENRLTEVPTHVIDRLFNLCLDQVKFGGNPWNCECKTVSPFHNLLVRNVARYKDIDEIRCATDGFYHPSQPIYKLSTSDFCIVGTHINPLDIVNAVLVVVIFIILAKVVYDYIRLKQTGRIPVGPFTCTNYRVYQ